MDAREQQQGMDPFGGMFEAFGFGGKTMDDACLPTKWPTIMIDSSLEIID